MKESTEVKKLKERKEAKELSLLLQFVQLPQSFMSFSGRQAGATEGIAKHGRTPTPIISLSSLNTCSKMKEFGALKECLSDSVNINSLFSFKSVNSFMLERNQENEGCGGIEGIPAPLIASSSLGSF